MVASILNEEWCSRRRTAIGPTNADSHTYDSFSAKRLDTKVYAAGVQNKLNTWRLYRLGEGNIVQLRYELCALLFRRCLVLKCHGSFSYSSLVQCQEILLKRTYFLFLTSRWVSNGLSTFV